MTDLKTPFPEVKEKNKKRIFAACLLFKSLIYSFAIFGILFILLLFVVLDLLRQDGGRAQPVPKSAILAIDFDAPYSETRGDNIMTEIAGGVRSQTFLDLITAINVAAADSRVKAIAANVSISSLGLAQIQDLRDTIKNFRASGKKAYLFSSGFGSFGRGTKEYYLATAFDKIVMAPNSEAGITGISIEVPFFRKALDKIGVTPEFYSRYEYKSAMNSLTDFQMSKPYREEMSRMGGSIFNRFAADVSKARGMSEKELKKLVDNAPLSADDALKAGLIDEISYRQDWQRALEKDYNARPIAVWDYIGNISTYGKGVQAVAFLVIDGVIAEGESYAGSIRNETVTGADTVLEQLEEISENKDVKALIVRVNSPGGAYGASDDIWHALEQLKTQKKIPVIVSMGDYAASGGYFVALAGDKIIAEPSTITGSIGVLGGKMVLEQLWKKIGVNWNSVNFGENAGILSFNTKFSNKEKSIFNKSLDIIYKDFTLKVSKARNLDLNALDKLARGRVWTGEDALKHNLVDGTGGLETAFSEALKAAKIKPAEKFRILYYPKEKTLQEKIQQLVNGGRGVYMSGALSVFSSEINELKQLNRLRYDAVLPPMQINM